MSEDEVRAKHEHSALVAANRRWAVGTPEVGR